MRTAMLTRTSVCGPRESGEYTQPPLSVPAAALRAHHLKRLRSSGENKNSRSQYYCDVLNSE